METSELLEILNKKEYSLKELVEEIPDINFTDYILVLLEKAKLSKAEVIQRTNIERTYAYQVFNGRKIPGRDKVLQMAFALSLDTRYTNNLLSLSKNESLYPKVKRDALLIHGLNNNYSLMTMNELLDEYKFDILK